MDERDLVARARVFAAEVHAGDKRKGSDKPYFDHHLESVAELVRRSGGTDVQIAAAYLHDAAEDHGGQQMLDRIRTEFGEDVADIVGHLSDSFVDTDSGEIKAPWPERKQTYIDLLAASPTTSLEVSVADKLHNAQSILDDYEVVGDGLWDRFNERRPGAQLWYYSSLAQIFRDRIPAHPLTPRLSAVVDDLERRVVEVHPELADHRSWPTPDRAP
jgi:(p)ppGpp synthase/HD superfamily hydrolase